MREENCRFAFIGASNAKEKERKEGRGKWEIINVSQDISKFPPVVAISLSADVKTRRRINMQLKTKRMMSRTFSAPRGRRNEWLNVALALALSDGV